MSYTSEMVKVESKACDSCRKLRVGCDREVPSCGRCRLGKHTCSYQHLLKREAKRLLKVNDNKDGINFDESAHLVTYRAFPPPSSTNETSKPLVLKWVDDNHQDSSVPSSTIGITSTFQVTFSNQTKPSQNSTVKAKGRKFSNANLSSDSTIPSDTNNNNSTPKLKTKTKTKLNTSNSTTTTATLELIAKRSNIQVSKRLLVRLVSTITSMKFASSLPHMFQILRVKNFTLTKMPVLNLAPKPGTTTKLLFQSFQDGLTNDKEMVIVALGGQSEIMPAWRHLKEQAFEAHFRYENSLEVLFLGQRGFDYRPRSHLLRLSIFLSGIRYIPTAPRPLVLELLALVTNELRSHYHRPRLDTIQALMILYRAYMNHLLNPLVSTCLNIATAHCMTLGYHLESETSDPFFDLERTLAYRSLFVKDSSSYYALSTHPTLSDDLTPTSSLESCLRRLARDPNGTSLLTDDNKCILILSDFHLWEGCVIRKLVQFRHQQSHRQPTKESPESLELAFRRGCVTHLAKLYTILSRHSPDTILTTSPLLPLTPDQGFVTVAINYITLRLHMWIVYLYPLQPSCPDPLTNSKLHLALQSASRVIDLHESFGPHPYFLSGSPFLASALLHLRHPHLHPHVNLQIPIRALRRLIRFEPIWSLSQHMQRPIREGLKELGALP